MSLAVSLSPHPHPVLRVCVTLCLIVRRWGVGLGDLRGNSLQMMAQIPMAVVVQPMAVVGPGEDPVPVVDFGMYACIDFALMSDCSIHPSSVLFDTVNCQKTGL